MSQMVCPACGINVHRSHSRHALERFVRSFSSYKLYKCSGCGWRGFLAPIRKRNWKKLFPTIVLWFISLVLATLLAFYLTESYRTQHPRPDPTESSQ
jgi:predicted RNA-binding Zn-ribbon protein involved in translation (DUF1610 family)